MRTFAVLLSLASLLLVACGGSSGSAGPSGPPGPAGPPGADGLIGTIFEVEVDFTAANGFEALAEFPPEIEVFDTDIVVAYVLSEVDEGVDVWEPLPQTLFFGPDILLYGFDYTAFDINFFLDGTVDLAGLDPIYTDALIFRVAILPADFAVPLNAASLAEMVATRDVEQVIHLD